MDSARVAFIEEFKPSNPYIPYNKYAESITDGELVMLIVWLKSKARTVIHRQDLQRTQEIVDLCTLFAKVADEIRMNLYLFNYDRYRIIEDTVQFVEAIQKVHDISKFGQSLIKV